jgi:hypothetical protein
MTKTLTFLFFISSFSNLIAQDSTRFYDHIKLSWEADAYYAPQIERRISLPETIKSQRYFKKFASDNPLHHGASAFGLRIESALIKNYNLDVRLMAEHRGISYGVFNTASMIVYPIFRFNFVDTLRFKNAKWVISGQVGQERNFSQGEGLYLYNLNCHAERLRIQVHPHVILETFHIGDLSEGIGLALDEVFQQSIIFKDIPLSKNAQKLTVQLSLTKWEGLYTPYYQRYQNPDERVFLPEIMAHFYPNRATKIYTHLSFKPVTTPYQIDSAVYYKPTPIGKIAGLVGINWQRKTEKLNIETVFEARYYGKSFNFERAERSSFYRNRSSFFGYNATIGQNLYPLASYDRPFSQWGVFTEYNHKNVGGLTLRAKGNYQLRNPWYWYFDLDDNLIFADGERPFNYLFVSTGLNYKFRKDIDCGIGLTNKGMNLDVFYPTFYYHRKPSLFIFLKKTLM